MNSKAEVRSSQVGLEKVTHEPPMFSGIIAIYNNADYARKLYKSIEAQTVDRSSLEIVLVNDGSTDNSLEIATDWKKTSNLDIRIISKENGGVASARNLGIDNARGTWITFIDSDDILDKNYFSALKHFNNLDSYRSASMLTTRSILYYEDIGTTIDNHPLSWKYKSGDRLVSLTLEPHAIHLGGHSTTVRRTVVMENALIFRDTVRPAFEDADFIGRYLALFPEPVLGLVASARYYYRKRADRTSLIDTTWTKVEKFTQEPKYGHLGMLSDVTARLGYTPIWAQNMVLYSLYWYFYADKKWDSPFATMPQDILDEFWGILEEIFSYIDSDAIRNFSLMNYGWYLSEGILRHYKNQAWISSPNPVVYKKSKVDQVNNTSKYIYSYSKILPKEEIYIDNELSEPVSSKSVVQRSFGNTLMFERIIVVPAGKFIQIRIGGKFAQIFPYPAKNRLPKFRTDLPAHLVLLGGGGQLSPQERIWRLRSKKTSNILSTIQAPQALSAKAFEEAWVTDTTVCISGFRIVQRVVKRNIQKWKVVKNTKRDRRTVSLATSANIAMEYKDAWLFIDRPERADDNAEHLYKFVRNFHPEINIWYMLSEESPDWQRLKSEGFSLIPFGTDAAIAPVLNAKFIISSHMDNDIYHPVSPQRFGSSHARRIFLQHGMVMNDISKWLNTKELTLMLASATGEYEYFTADGSPYAIGKNEVRLTGLPRHDKLVDLARTKASGERRQILVVPTWRKNLAEDLSKLATNQARKEMLLENDFYVAWMNVLNSGVITALARDEGLDIVFVLHDHLAQYESIFNFGPKVKVQSYSDMSVQDLLIASKLVITDYSSIATEAVIAGTAVVYYQYDLEAIYDGGHSFKQGWFDYVRDGFGPVVAHLDDLESFVVALRNNSWKSDELYTDRLKRSLPFLDGSVCERVFDELASLG